MLETALASGLAHTQATFEVFSRSLPPGRRFGVLAGTGRLASAIEAFRFSPEDCEYLVSSGVIGKTTRAYLEEFRFHGDITAYPEGELYFPFSPVVRVDAPFGEGLLLETIILSILNFDTAIASTAVRMSLAARGANLIEMGSRRTHEWAAVDAARAAYIGGFDSTSNLAAGLRYGIPTAGTSGHAAILAHSSEREAFLAQLAVSSSDTTALVDTYEVDHGIRQAIAVFGNELAAIRIDSGELGQGARRARALLDALGATKTKIIVSGDLDEDSIANLAGEPIDGFGVGTKLVTGSGAPTAGFVYKLVSICRDNIMTPVAKKSVDKHSSGGAKAAYRILSPDGIATAEWSFDPQTEISATGNNTLMALSQPLVKRGATLPAVPLTETRKRARESLANFRTHGDPLEKGEPYLRCAYQGPDLGHDTKY